MSMTKEQRKEALLKRYSATAQVGGKNRGMRPGGRGPGGGRGMAGGKPKNGWHTIKKLLAYIGQDKYKIVLVFFCVLFATLSTLGGTYLLKPIIDGLVTKGVSAETRIHNLFSGLIVMAGVYLVGVICSYLQQRIMISVSQNATQQIRSELFQKLQALPLRYHDTHLNGDIMSRFTNDLESVAEMLNNTFSQLFSGIITVVGTITLMFITNWILAIIIVVSVPVLLYVGGSLGKRSKKYYKTQQRALGAVNGYIEESVVGQKVIKVFSHEDVTTEEFEILSDDLRDKQRKAQFFGGIMGPVMGNLSQVTFTLSGAIGGILCLNDMFTFGGLTVFTKYSREFARPISELSMLMNTIFSALAGAERVFEVMDEDSEDGYEDNKIKICSADNKIDGYKTVNATLKFDHVTFGYNPDKTILKDININVKQGQKIAFVGSTGAGKTTITNLINRFYDVNNGAIYIDGININDINKQTLRSNITMVLQDTHLFSDTVRENIRYGRLDASDDEVISAAKAASAHSFITKLANGYDTKLDGDGTNLSQGERQLLNIARASISKAPILILDEATSSVDTRTEKLIEQGMDSLMKSRTTFIIAHRLSTVRNADMIIVLEHGEIVEQGTHSELLDKKGRYYDLYTGAVELD